MKRITLLFILSVSFLFGLSQDMTYSRIRIYTGFEGIQKLLTAGVPVDDAEINPGAYIICELSQRDIEKVRAEGFNFEVLIRDVSKFYEERSAKEMDIIDQIRYADNLLDDEWPVPDGFELGTVGGFCSIDQMLDQLDSMLTHYPDLISPVYQFDSLTCQGRPLYWVRISDNPTQNEDEPEVLYTGMHHAREPIGMQHLLFFMNYLLENYATSAEIQSIVNDRELYFIPIVNMDGYARNILTNPNGGGSWRKNRRDNGDGTYGVDINRNYGFAWGYSSSGSSGDPVDDDYRGPSAFSEPETQDIRDFCEAHEFRIALNYHAYANLLLYAWGYIPDLPPDNEQLSAYGEIMTAENGYLYGPSNTTIYVTNGSSDDWMYGEQGTKDKILAYTPEVGVGSDGFWPSVSRIIPLCQENMWQSMMAAKLAGPYAITNDKSNSIIQDLDGYFKIDIERLGMDETATYTVYISPVNDAITSIGEPLVYTDLALFETRMDSIPYSLKDDIEEGDQIIYALSIDNGEYTSSEIINKIYGTPVVIFSDEGNTLENWTSSMWDVTTEDFHSPDKCITDSPYGNYNNYEVNAMVLKDPIDLTNATTAVLSFWAKWEIQAGYDYVQVEASTNQQVWTPLSGNYTKEGTENQVPGEPVYDGFQTDWVYEEMSLADFVGQEIYLRFLLRANVYITEDGFYWDDLGVTIIDNNTAVNEPGLSYLKVSGPVPNPASELIRFNVTTGKDAGELSLRVYSSTGKLVLNQPVTNQGEIELPVTGWSKGLYLYQFAIDGHRANSGKFIVK